MIVPSAGHRAWDTRNCGPCAILSALNQCPVDTSHLKGNSKAAMDFSGRRDAVLHFSLQVGSKQFVLLLQEFPKCLLRRSSNPNTKGWSISGQHPHIFPSCVLPLLLGVLGWRKPASFLQSFALHCGGCPERQVHSRVRDCHF